MAVLVSGEWPAVMAEGSRPGDWFALLRLGTDRGNIASVEAIGPGAHFISLTWNKAQGTVALQPGAVADYEAFLEAGEAPELAFSFRLRMGTGRIDENGPTIRIGLLDVDDTPPAILGFSSGGSVTAGAIGAVIGTLAITDPDSTGPFHFFFPEDEAWRFEVVDGTTLKLRDGISLGLDDMPRRPLLIEVSDGRQGQAFLIDFAVLDPGAPPIWVPQPIAAGELRGAIGVASADRALVLREAADLAGLAMDGSGNRGLALHSQAEEPLPAAVGRIDFADARLELAPDGTAGRAAALHRTLAGEGSDPAGVARSLAALEQGAGLVAEAARQLQARGAAMPEEDAAFIEALHRDAAGRAPTAEELALHLGRLGSGESRAQVAADIALMAAPPDPAPILLPWTIGRGAPADTAPPPPPEAAPPVFAVDLLFG